MHLKHEIHIGSVCVVAMCAAHELSHVRVRLDAFGSLCRLQSLMQTCTQQEHRSASNVRTNQQAMGFQDWT